VAAGFLGGMSFHGPSGILGRHKARLLKGPTRPAPAAFRNPWSCGVAALNPTAPRDMPSASVWLSAGRRARQMRHIVWPSRLPGSKEHSEKSRGSPRTP